jgi:cysteine desulfuration protein SufE
MQEQATTIDERQQRIIDELNGREDWFDKYEYLIALGKDFPPEEEGLKTDRYALKGCQSRVWVRAEVREGVLYFTADSDSMITRGMLALVLAVLQGTAPADAAYADLYFIERTGLAKNLSPARANGLNTIAAHMQGLAQDLM